jgi:methionine synthase II (cobalamin-independent)
MSAQEGAQLKADGKKQQELDALKAKIFVGKAKDLVQGYMESLIGEKLKVYEDENDTQQALEAAQQSIKESVKANTKSLVRLEDPEAICYRNTHSIEDSIAEIEAGLKNQMYSQLAKIWKDDAERKRGLKSTRTTKQSKL